MVSGVFELKPLEEKGIEISPAERIIKELFGQGWFKEKRKVNETLREIRRRGASPSYNTVRNYLLQFAKEGKMFNEKGKFIERTE